MPKNLHHHTAATRRFRAQRLLHNHGEAPIPQPVKTKPVTTTQALSTFFVQEIMRRIFRNLIFLLSLTTAIANGKFQLEDPADPNTRFLLTIDPAFDPDSYNSLLSQQICNITSTPVSYSSSNPILQGGPSNAIKIFALDLAYKITSNLLCFFNTVVGKSEKDYQDHVNASNEANNKASHEVGVAISLSVTLPIGLAILVAIGLVLHNKWEKAKESKQTTTSSQDVHTTTAIPVAELPRINIPASAPTPVASIPLVQVPLTPVGGHSVALTPQVEGAPSKKSSVLEPVRIHILNPSEGEAQRPAYRR